MGGRGPLVISVLKLREDRFKVNITGLSQAESIAWVNVCKGKHGNGSQESEVRCQTIGKEKNRN